MLLCAPPSSLPPSPRSDPVPATAEPTTDTSCLVLYQRAGADKAVDKAIAEAGGTITSTSTKIGYAYVTTMDARFVSRMRDTDAVAGVAQERTIGVAPKERRARAQDR